MQSTRVSLGSISHGTMRNEDLIPCFVDELERITGGCPLVDQVNGHIDASDEYFKSEESDFDLEELFEALGTYAPDYCHFGANEGDGSDYGYWPSMDSIEDDVRCGTVLKIDAGDEWPELDADVTHVFEVNDHGNCALYTREHTLCWDCV